MTKIKVVTTAQPSPTPILCDHCRVTLSPWPVCGPCQRAYLRRQVPTSAAPAEESPLDAIAKRVAAGNPERRHKRGDRKKRAGHAKRDNVTLDALREHLSPEEAGWLAVLRTETKTGADAVGRRFKQWGAEVGKDALAKAWGIRQRRIDAYTAATGMAFTDIETVAEWERDQEMERRKREAR